MNLGMEVDIDEVKTKLKKNFSRVLMFLLRKGYYTNFDHELHELFFDR
jgi:hypothetical protein